MAGKRQRKSRRRKLLEKYSEEKLMERRAALQRMLIQVDSEERSNFTDTSNGENSEPEINERTRAGSPFPTARSLSPGSESYDEVDKSGHRGKWRNQTGRHGNWGNKPFYCLPANRTHPSTSSGYSKAFDATYQTQRDTREDDDLFKNLRRSKETRLSAIPPKEDVWVPLTFLDPSQKYFGSDPADPKSVSRPKMPDLRRRVTECSVESNTWSPSETWELPRKERKIANLPVEVEERGTNSHRRPSAEVTIQPRKKIKIEKSLGKTREEINSPMKLRTSSTEMDLGSRSGITGPEIKKEPAEQEIKVEKQSKEVEASNTEDFKPLGLIPTDMLFSACVSIAADIPEEALMSLKNLQIPKLEMKVEQPEVITTEEDDFENSEPCSRVMGIENVEEKNNDDSESVASNDKIFEAVVKSLIEEKLQEGVETGSRENSRASSEEKNENAGRNKIDFGKEIEKFTIKLRIIKSVEEKMKEY